MNISLIIRTLNEDRYLSELLDCIKLQKFNGDCEIVLVDSGSTDKTLEIARQHNARILSIHENEFTFGRSLNWGCAAATGDYLAFISGHCIPTDHLWLQKLVSPLADGVADYVYGKQTGRDSTKFSEQEVFNKYYASANHIPQEGFFCNNANAAIKRSVWEKYRFNEELTGLEDMYLGSQLVNQGGKIGYVADACVFHIHNESWGQIKRRFEREAIALQKIMPEVHISTMDLFYLIVSGIISDMRKSFREKSLWQNFMDILSYRTCQYWGSYIGNHEHRKLSEASKRKYFYPNQGILKKHD